ncbi:MAG: OsmC family protein [Gemmatimonadetes bacterium]|nr:OsmC family protein [Gemmatimonadota bacterium]
MKITLLADDAIRLEPVPGPLTIEAPTAQTAYSPFHMLASALATCIFSVIESWASHAKHGLDDLTIEVRWKFADEPHRVSDFAVSFDWPSLPANRIAAARRVAELCTVHATLHHPPHIAIEPASRADTAQPATPAGSAA